MPSLKDLRNRISSVASTRKMTRAMQMVSAAKLRKAQRTVEAARPYAEHMERILSALAKDAASGAHAEPLVSGNGRDQVHLLLVCTAERGLCGALNTSVVRSACWHIEELLESGKQVKIVCVGARGMEQLSRLYPDKVVESIDLGSARQVDLAFAKVVADRVAALFQEGAFDVCVLFFSRFRSAISQRPESRRLIPLALGLEEESPGRGGRFAADR